MCVLSSKLKRFGQNGKKFGTKSVASSGGEVDCLWPDAAAVGGLRSQGLLID